MDRKCDTEEKESAIEKKAADENEIRSLSQENSKLKEEVSAWRKGFAMMMKKEKKLLAEIDIRKKRNADLGHMAKKEKKRRILVKKRYRTFANSLRIIEGSSKDEEQTRNEATVKDKNGEDDAPMPDNCSRFEENFTYLNDVYELTKRNEYLASQVEFLEIEQRLVLGEYQEIRDMNLLGEISREKLEAERKEMEEKLKSVIMENEEVKLKLFLLDRDFDEEKLKRLSLERALEVMQKECEDLRAYLQIESPQRNVSENQRISEIEVMESEKDIERSQKVSSNLFQKFCCNKNKADL